MAFAREIILFLIQWLKFRISKTEEKDSYYGELGGTLIRISNHCTRLWVWDYMLEKNPQWRGKPIISIVFEDDASTFDKVECLVLKRFRKKPIKVLEFVYNLGGDPNYLDKRDLKTILNSMRIISNGKFSDRTGKCQPPVMRISQNPNRYTIPTNITDNGGTYLSANAWGADYVSESKNIYKYNQNNCNRNMRNKKVVRLTESQLHNIIAESVERVLREAVPDYGMKTMQAYGNNQQYSENYANSLRKFWSEKGLSGDALERKVQEILHNKAASDYGNYGTRSQQTSLRGATFGNNRY